MASWTTPNSGHVTGDDFSITDANTLAANEIFLYQTPYAAYFNSVSTPVPNSMNTPITLGGTSAAGYGFSVVSNNIVMPLTGIYQVSFCATSGDQDVGTAQSIWQVSATINGSAVLTASSNIDIDFGAHAGGAGVISCSAGAPLGLVVFQDAGGSVPTSPGANATYLHAYFVGSQ